MKKLIVISLFILLVPSILNANIENSNYFYSETLISGIVIDSQNNFSKTIFEKNKTVLISSSIDTQNLSNSMDILVQEDSAPLLLVTNDSFSIEEKENLILISIKNI